MAHLKKYWLLIGVPITVVLATLLAIRIVNAMNYHHNDNDFFRFWLAGHLITLRGNPYDILQLVAGYHQFDIGFIPSDPIFLYPLPLAIILAPLGTLAFHTAYVLWVTLNQLIIIVSLAVLLSLERHPHTKLLFIPIFAGIVLFRPTLLILTQGQISGLFLFVLVWIAYLWQKGKWFWGGFLLGLLVLRPNLGILIIALLFIWLFTQKRWTAILGIPVSGIALLIIGLFYNPGWIIQYWNIGNNKLSEAFRGYPTVWSLGALISHNQANATLIIGGVAALLILLGFFWTVLRARESLGPVNVLALAITVALLITPYTWTYDQLLLIIPITAVILAMHRLGSPFLLTATIFLGIDVLFFVALFFDTMSQVETLNVVVPAVVLSLCLFYMNPRMPTRK